MQGRCGGPAGGSRFCCGPSLAHTFIHLVPPTNTCSAEAPVVAQLVAASGVLRRCAKIAVAHPNCRWVPRQLWVPAVLLAACDSLWPPPWLCRQHAFASVLWWPQRTANASFSECCILQRVLHLALGAPDWYLVFSPPRSAIHGAVARCLKLSLSKPVGQVRPCTAQHTLHAV